MRAVAALVLLATATASAGCAGLFASPRSQLTARTIQPAGTREGAIDVQVEIEAQMLIMTAVRRDECVYSVTETIAIAVPSWRRQPTMKQRAGGQITRPCATPAVAATIRVTLPTGETVYSVSDEEGHVVLLLGPHEMPAAPSEIRATVVTPGQAPDGEDGEAEWMDIAPPADAGTPVTPRATDASLAAGKPRKGLSIVREALLECGGRHQVRGLVRVKLMLAEQARITAASTGRTGAFQHCIEAALIGELLPISRPPGNLEFPYVIQ